jgi:hypothetical protein
MVELVNEDDEEEFIIVNNNNDVLVIDAANRNMVTAVFATSMTIITRKFATKSQSHSINHVIDYADAILCKLKDIDIHSAHDLSLVIEDGHTMINTMLHSAGHPKMHRATVDELHKESNRTKVCSEADSNRYYNEIITAIRLDDDADPSDDNGIRDIIEGTAITQLRHAPIRWTNKITVKLITCGINTPQSLDYAIRNGTLNSTIEMNGDPALHKITIRGIKQTMDFRQGRS